MKRVSRGSATVPAPRSARTPVDSVAPGRQPAAARPPIDRTRGTPVPWLLVLIVIGALAMAGVLIVVLARLVVLAPIAPGTTPGPAPLSRSQNPGADDGATPEWTGVSDPKYAR